MRVLEPSHRAMNSSLHPLAASEELDLGAFLYATRRLPDEVADAKVIVMGQEAIVFKRVGIGPIEDWEPLEAPARRRRWFHDGDGTLAVLLASTSDLDDLIPTLVAYQIEWNKMRVKMRAADAPRRRPDAGRVRGRARRLGGGLVAPARRVGRRLRRAPARRRRAAAQPARADARRQRGRLRAHDAPLVAPGAAHARGAGARGAPDLLRSSNAHSIVNLVTGTAREREAEICDWVDRSDDPDLRPELERFRSGEAEGSWENFLYFAAREYFTAHPEDSDIFEQRSREERAVGVTHLSSTTALRVSAQVIDLSRLDTAALDPRLGVTDGARLAACDAVIVNIEYPLGLAAYNILREITEDTDRLRGVYVLGKAATLNADVGDVMISSVIHDEHSASTYWLDNAFSVDDIAPFLVFGSGLDNQRAVTVKSTFLQNREYLDYYYREAFTVVEMEAGPFCDAVYEIADVDRYPVGEAVNFSKLPIDFGIIHYASDTPYTQARTLGARGLSYYGMDSTYASSLAIVRRVLALEGVLDAP